CEREVPCHCLLPLQDAFARATGPVSCAEMHAVYLRSCCFFGECSDGIAAISDYLFPPAVFGLNCFERWCEFVARCNGHYRAYRLVDLPYHCRDRLSLLQALDWFGLVRGV